MADGPRYQPIRLREDWESLSGSQQGVPLDYERGKRVGQHLEALAADRWEPVATERDGDNSYVILLAKRQ